MEGGTLLETIEKRGHLSEQEASLVIRDIANALQHLHKKGYLLWKIKVSNIKTILKHFWKEAVI